MDAKTTLLQGAARFSLAISDEQAAAFDTYSKLLIEYNKKVNLTRITEPEEIAEKHFVDSLAPLSMIDLPQNAKVVDVGTGAGFPGVPMKILRPDLRLTLLDSLQKRLDFLSELSQSLGQENELIHARAEAGGADPALREKFDAAVSRAVAKMSVLSEYCLPYVRTGGLFLALKGPEIEKELGEAKNAVALLGGGEPKVFEYCLSTGDRRTLVVIKKIRPTPKKYPRQRVKLTEKPL